VLPTGHVSECDSCRNLNDHDLDNHNDPAKWHVCEVVEPRLRLRFTLCPDCNTAHSVDDAVRLALEKANSQRLWIRS
jgi:hypothetical protein